MSSCLHLLLLSCRTYLQRSQFADKMKDKQDVEGAVNPVGALEEDDDPFLVSDRQHTREGGSCAEDDGAATG